MLIKPVSDSFNETDDQLNDNQKSGLDSTDSTDQQNSSQLSEPNSESNNSSSKKKKTKRSSSQSSSECIQDDEQIVNKESIKEEEQMDKLNNQLNDKSNCQSNKSKRNKKGSPKMSDKEGLENLENIKDNSSRVDEMDQEIEQLSNEDESLTETKDEETDDKKQQDAMRALFSRLQGIDSEPADLLSACSKKKKKVTTKSSPKSSNNRSPNASLELASSNDNESENDKNNFNNNLLHQSNLFQSNEQSTKRTKRKDNKDEDESSEQEDMQCDNEEDESLNQSWSSNSSKKSTRLAQKLLNDPLNGLLSNQESSSTNSNKKRKLNQQQINKPTAINALVNQLNTKDLSTNEMLAKYQSQFAQLSQQLLLNNQFQNQSASSHQSAINDSLMSSFIAAVNNSNSLQQQSNTPNSSSNLTPSPLSNTSQMNLNTCPSPKSSINTSSSLDKLTSIVDSIDKINVNQSKTTPSSNLSGGNSTPGLSDSDNGSNLLLQLPTLSSLNKSSKQSPSLYCGSNSGAGSFQDVFNNMKSINQLLPHQLLELQQTNTSNNQLFQPAPIKSPSTSSTHSSHSSSPSPNFFAKLSSNVSNATSNATNSLSSLASTLSGLTGLNPTLTNQLSNNSKQTNLKNKLTSTSGGLNPNSIATGKSSSKSSLSANHQSMKLSQQQQLNNLLRQHAALQLLQQSEQDDMFDECDKDEEEEEDDAFDFNSQLLKQLKKQMIQKQSKNDDHQQLAASVLGGSPLDLSCKKDGSVGQSLNALIASKLLESGSLGGLSNLNQLNQLNNLSNLTGGLSSLFGGDNSSIINNSNLANLGINNLAQLNQLNSLLNANNLLNNSNQNKSFGRFDLLTSLLGASTNQQQTNLAALNPLLGLNLNQQLQQQQNSMNKKKDSSNASFKNNLNNSNNSNNLLSPTSSLGSQLVSPNSSSFWSNLSSTSKIKPYSASSSLHTPNPKAMQLRERSSSGQGRQNPWQTQWMNRSSEQNRDVFTCVYCRLTFNSLDEMTQHMKISPRCGMAGMQQANAVSAASSHSTSSNTTNNSSNMSSTSIVDRSLIVSGSSASNQHHSSSSKSKQLSATLSASSALVSSLNKDHKDKSGNQVPRKLVRGQDVWLGRGAEQTRQILKCIWCQESFKTLDDLSKHMHVTQHFMNIISPEQITSWKQPDDKSQQSQMNQVLTCKVCDESFPSLKELSAHIQKTSHFKDNNNLLSKADSASIKLLDRDRQSPSGLSTTSSTSTTGGLSNDHQLSNGTQQQQKKRNSSNGSSSTTNQSSNNNGKEKRKKSLPVRKLLELERNIPMIGSNGQHNSNSNLDNTAANSLSRSLLEKMNLLFGASNDKLRNGYNMDALSSHSNDESENSLNINNSNQQYQSAITCDECKECMDVNQFIIHLKHCKPSQMNGPNPNAQLLNFLVAAAAQQQDEQEKSSSSLVMEEDNKSSVNNSLLEDEEEDIDSEHKLNGSNNKKDFFPLINKSSKEKAEKITEARSESRQSGGDNSNRTTPQLNGQSPKSTTSNKQLQDEKKSGSVLSALEYMIETSFDPKSKKSTNSQGGILQRLGIDEEICSPWQNANSPPTNTTNSTNAMLPNTGSFP